MVHHFIWDSADGYIAPIILVRGHQLGVGMNMVNTVHHFMMGIQDFHGCSHDGIATPRPYMITILHDVINDSYLRMRYEYGPTRCVG